MTNLGEKIQKIRKENGMTQVDLGDKLCISAQAVSKWENNASEPDLDTLKKLCDIFGVSIGYFIETEVSEPADVTPRSEHADNGNKAESEPRIEVQTRVIVGYCSRCKRPIEGSEKYELDPVTNHLMCTKCHAERQMAHAQVEIKDKKCSIGWGFIWGGVAAAVVVAAFICLGVLWMDSFNIFGVIGFGVVVAYAAFAFIVQLFMDGVVCDWMDFFCRSFQMPGLIFTFDLDGIMWLIGMKILLAILSWVLSAFCFLAGVGITSTFAMFSFPFAMLAFRKELGEEQEKYSRAKSTKDAAK